MANFSRMTADPLVGKVMVPLNFQAEVILKELNALHAQKEQERHQYNGGQVLSFPNSDDAEEPS